MFDAHQQAMRNHEDARRRHEEARRHHQEHHRAAVARNAELQRRQWEDDRRRRRLWDDFGNGRGPGMGAARAPSARGRVGEASYGRSAVAPALVLAVIVAALVGAIASYRGLLPGAEIDRKGVVNGTSTVTLNVRSGPSQSATIVGQLQPGDRIEIACRTRSGWDRLAEPHEGAYVFDEFVARSERPKACA